MRQTEDRDIGEDRVRQRHGRGLSETEDRDIREDRVRQRHRRGQSETETWERTE